MSTRLFIGVITFYVLAQVICNFVEGNNYLTNANVAEIKTMTNTTLTSSASTTGTSTNFVDIGNTAIGTVKKLLFFDYSIFKDVDYSTTEAACTIIGGQWDSSISACKTDNDFVILKYMFIAIGIVMFVELAIVFKSLFSL